MAMHRAFRKHGTFTYKPGATMDRHRVPGDRVAGLVQALKNMEMTHVWVRLFGAEGKENHAGTQQLVDGLKQAGFNLAGWGFCFGSNWKKDRDNSIDQCVRYGLDAFIMDAEPGRQMAGIGTSRWTESDFDSYVEAVSQHFGKDNFGISTWPMLQIQNGPNQRSVALMRLAAGRVAMFAPQAYWMRYPKAVHYNSTGLSQADFPPDDPASFVRMVVAAWRKLQFTTPLVITGQAYWGEGGLSQSMAEQKLATFASGFSAWSSIVGFNWWHAGGKETSGALQKAMSPAMTTTIAAGHLGQKPYG
jgi:hypothetical protein